MENLENKEDEEVSLVDLLSVCLRYRKLIVIGTVVVTIFAALYLFVAPLVFKKKFEKPLTYNVSYTIRCINVPSCIKNDMGGASVASIASTRLKNNRFIANENKKYAIFGCKNDVGYEYTKNVNKSISKKKFSVGGIYLGTDFDISINIQEKSFELFSNYVNDSVKTVNTELENYIFPILENYKKLVDTKGNLKYPEVKLFEDNYTSFISILDEPYIVQNEVQKGRAKKLIIAFFAAFFVTILLSFIINSIKNMKADKEVSEKISSAWEAGK